MKTKEIYFIGGCSGVGKTTLITPGLIDDKIKIHTGDIARNLPGKRLDEISETIFNKIENYEQVIIDSHYAAINRKTGYNIFYQGLEDKELRRLADIPKKIFILLEGDPNEILKRRSGDCRKRSFSYKQILEDLYENRKNYYHYLKLTGAEGHIIQNSDLKVTRNKLFEIFL